MTSKQKIKLLNSMEHIDYSCCQEETFDAETLPNIMRSLDTELAERNKFPQTETTVDVIDAVPVVRCKDCKHYNTIGCSKGFGWCENMDRGTSDNFYCANGKQLNKESGESEGEE